MAQQYDNREGRGKSADTSTDNAQLDKAKMPEQNRQDVRKGLHPDSRKGAEVLNQGVKDRSGDFGRDAIGDPSRQARPQMIAMISAVLPELSTSQSPQRDAFLKAFENPALIRSYLINPQETTAYLSQRFPDMKGTLEKNMPFQKVGAHIEVNKDSAMYERVKQEVQIGLKPSDSFIQREMNNLLYTPFGASIGGSSGMETKAYEIVRNRIETNDQFNKAAERIELRMSKLMTSPQAMQDLKEAKGLAAMGPLGASTGTRPAQTGVPTTTGASVQGDLKPVQGNIKVSQTAPVGGVPTTTGATVQGALKPVVPSQPTISVQATVPGAPLTVPAIAAGVAGATLTPPGISVPGIAATTAIAGVGLTATTPGIQAKIPVPEATKPPVVEAKPQVPSAPAAGGVPTTDGTKVQGDLKPVSPTNTAPDTKPDQAKDLKPAPATTPSPVNEQITQENKQLTETIAKLNATLAKNNAAMEAMTKKLQETEARSIAAETKAAAAEANLKESAAQNAALMKRLEESDRRAARAELRNEVNDQLRDKGQKVAGSKELDEAVKALSKPDQKELPSADEVVAKVTEAREATKQREVEIRKETARKINESMSKLPAEPSIKQTREWTDSNMQLFTSLDPQGQKAFVNYIQNVYKFQQERETFEPMAFFTRKIADAAVVELKGATRAETFRPRTTYPGQPPEPITVYPPDMVKIAEVLRSIDDLPKVRIFVQANPELTNLKDKLPKEGWIFKEDGAFQKSIDARLAGNKVEAEAHLIRSLISSGQVMTKEQRQKIQEARKADPSQTAAIDAFYNKTYGSDIASEVRTANKAALEKATQADEELKKAQEKAKQAKDAASDLLE